MNPADPSPDTRAPATRTDPPAAASAPAVRGVARRGGAVPLVGSEDLPRMSLLDHLEELRRRITYGLVAIVVACLVCWTFVRDIYSFLEAPIRPFLPEGTKLSYLGPADPLMLYVKVALLAGVFLAAPVILYQVWRFVSPGLYPKERRWAAPFILLGSLFFLAGGAFAYYVAFPFAVRFLLGIGDLFQPVITIERYFRFLMTVILGLGLMFELPILIFLLAQIGLVTPRFLMRHFRWAVLIIFFVAALVTPTPDVINLCVFAVPTLGLYLLGVFAAWVSLRGRAKRQEPR
jgi:sec-independent protein translocase protein TatC